MAEVNKAHGITFSGMLTHFWEQRDLVQNGRKTIWKFLPKLNICTPYAPSILPLGTHIHTHTQNLCMHVNVLNCFSHVRLFATLRTVTPGLLCMYTYMGLAKPVQTQTHLKTGTRLLSAALLTNKPHMEINQRLINGRWINNLGLVM